MPNPIPACFRRCAAGQPPPPAVQPTLTTSTYETTLGLAALTWSRILLGLSLRFHLRLTSAANPPSPDDDDDETLRFHVRPWLIWKRRGSKRFHLRGRRIDVSWDLSRALFPAASPEPSSNFYVSLSVDGENVLVAGDAVQKIAQALLSRREHVVLAAAGSRTYNTTARFGGREREISIELSGSGAAKEAAGMAVAVDGRRVLHVRRLRWKFRGSERVEVDGGGGRLHLSWDLHSWLFPSPPDAADASGGGGVFAFRFEAEVRGEEGRWRKEVGRRVVFDGGHFARSRNWSESSSGGGGERGGRKGKLVKTSSFSSTSSAASTGSGSTVMAWDSPEEAELRRAVGFTLLVHVWKN